VLQAGGVEQCLLDVLVIDLQRVGEEPVCTFGGTLCVPRLIPRLRSNLS